MDTKSKSIKYSIVLKTIAVITAILSAVSIVGSMNFLSNFHDEIKCDTYYETYKFNQRYTNLIYNIVELKIILKDENNINENLDSIKETYKDLGISYYMDRLNVLEYRISKSNNINLLYHIIDNDKNSVYSNTDNYSELELVKKHSINDYMNYLLVNETHLYSYLGKDIKDILEKHNCELYTTMSDPLKPGDNFYEDYNTFVKVKAISQPILITAIVSLVLLIISLIYLISVCGKSNKDSEVRLIFIDKVFFEFQTILVLLFANISMNTIQGYSFSTNIYEAVFILGIFAVDVIVGLSYILSFARLIKKKQFIQHTLIYKFITGLRNMIRLCVSGKVFKAWIIILFIAYSIIDTILLQSFFTGYGTIIDFAILVGFNVVFIYLVFKFLVSLSIIMENAKAISDGNLDYNMNTSKISALLIDFSNNIQNIRDGMKNAVNRALKGEKMKTALITNVSHDLKTPLTSIITYVDLLKKQDLDNETAVEYVNILDEKSNRLKNLIEDLIEASKASSGNLTVQQEKVNLNELIMQACGEYEDKINLSNLDMKINTDENQTYIYADSKYMWRIVENLLANVFKYSVPNTRVYIDIEKKNNFGVLTIKNISANALNISPEQLKERFVRGDEARTTEGSGLGLSIAQSLSTLQNGKFDIKIDGDLFKAIVSMPLWTDN